MKTEFQEAQIKELLKKFFFLSFVLFLFIRGLKSKLFMSHFVAGKKLKTFDCLMLLWCLLPSMGSVSIPTCLATGALVREPTSH